MTISKVILQGTPYERGETSGRTCAEQVKESLAIYREMFQAEHHLTSQEAIGIARCFLPAIKAFDPSYLEEMQGIADGAGVTFDEILMLNARSELLSGTRPTVDASSECTAFAALPPATSDGHVYAGQTWDFSPAQRKTIVVFEIRQNNGRPNVLMFTEAGLIGGKGFNSAGIGLTLNAVWRKGTAAGIPLHVRMRAILDSPTIDEAYSLAVRGPIPCGATLIMTHRSEVSYCLELSPGAVDILLPENGVIAHSNHFIGPRLCALQKNAPIGSTYIRLERMRQLLNDRKLNAGNLKKILCDHEGYPGSICMHPDPSKAKNKQMVTNYGLVMDLTEGCAYFAFGNPCESEFYKLQIGM